MKLVLYIIFIFLFFNFPKPIHSQNVKQILDTIPKEEREDLGRLFYSMMHDDHLVYTLFGDKPVSSSGYFKITPIQNICCGMKCQSIFWKHWQIWEKYAHNFPSNRYLLIKEEHPYRQVGNIILINKKAFIHQVNQHLDTFRKILGSNITGENLLAQIEQQQKFSPLIQNNSVLRGILLGYGEHNARLFERRFQIYLFVKNDSMPYQERLPTIPLKQPLPSEGFSSIEEENQSLRVRLRPFSDYDYSPIMIQSIHFMADSEHPETKALTQKYQELRSKISTIYAQGDFLEITLNQFISR